MTLIIRYSHTGPDRPADMAAAKSCVREQALRARAAPGAVVFVPTDDGDVLAYLDQAAANRDDTGAAAFAVITDTDRDED